MSVYVGINSSYSTSQIIAHKWDCVLMNGVPFMQEMPKSLQYLHNPQLCRREYFMKPMPGGWASVNFSKKCSPP